MMSETKRFDAEQLVELYERHFRTPTRCGPQSIREFLLHHQVDVATRELLVSDLIEIDLQLSWMQWDKSIGNRIESTSAEVIDTEFEQIPRLDSYASLLGVPPENTQTWRRIAKCEMDARYAWGDAIGPPWYKSQYGIGFQSDSLFEPNVVQCKWENTEAAVSNARYALRGRSIIGRQRSCDRYSSFSEELPTGNRIVVADLRDPKISREQLAVKLLNRKCALVRNLSELNPVMIVANGLLEPQQSQIVKFDFSIRLPGRRLYFYTPPTR